MEIRKNMMVGLAAVALTACGSSQSERLSERARQSLDQMRTGDNSDSQIFWSCNKKYEAALDVCAKAPYSDVREVCVKGAFADYRECKVFEG